MIKCILIGYGYWGKIIEQYIEKSTMFDLVGICSIGYDNSLEVDDVINNQDIEAVFVCTPLSTHYSIVMKMITAGKHVFCEKPLCQTYEECLQLITEATKNNKILFVDYIYTQSDSINWIKNNIKKIGKIKYIDLKIRQTGRFYKDCDVYENIGIHMISSLDYIFNSKTEEFKVINKFEDNEDNSRIGFVMFSIGDIKGSLNVSLFSDTKERTMDIIGEDGMLSFDMMGQEHTVSYSVFEQTDEEMKSKVFLTEKFDESNNLDKSIRSFYNDIRFGVSSTDMLALSVAKMMAQIKG